MDSQETFAASWNYFMIRAEGIIAAARLHTPMIFVPFSIAPLVFVFSLKFHNSIDFHIFAEITRFDTVE